MFYDGVFNKAFTDSLPSLRLILYCQSSLQILFFPRDTYPRFIILQRNAVGIAENGTRSCISTACCGKSDSQSTAEMFVSHRTTTLTVISIACPLCDRKIVNRSWFPRN